MIDSNYLSKNSVRSIEEQIDDGVFRAFALELKYDYQSHPEQYDLLPINIESCLNFDDWLQSNPYAFLSNGNRDITLKLLAICLDVSTVFTDHKIPVKKFNDTITWRTHYTSIFDPNSMPHELLHNITVGNSHTYHYTIDSLKIKLLFGLARNELLRQSNIALDTNNSSNGIGTAFCNTIEFIENKQLLINNLVDEIFHDCIVPDNYNFKRAKYLNEHSDRPFYKKAKAHRLLIDLYDQIISGNGNVPNINDIIIRERIKSHPLINAFSDEWNDIITVNLEVIRDHVDMLEELREYSEFFENGCPVKQLINVIYQRYETVIFEMIDEQCVKKSGANVIARLYDSILVDHSMEDYAFTVMLDVINFFDLPDNYLQLRGKHINWFNDTDELDMELIEHRRRIEEEERLSYEYAERKAAMGIVTAVSTEELVAREETDIQKKINSIISMGTDEDTMFDDWISDGIAHGMSISDARQYAIEKTKGEI